MYVPEYVYLVASGTLIAMNLGQHFKRMKKKNRNEIPTIGENERIRIG